MAKRINAGRVVLDWQRLLGFDQGSSSDGAGSSAALSPKIGPKEARGFNNCTAVPTTAAKVGQKESGIRQAKVGVKSDVRFGATLPVSVTAKIGNKDV